MAIVTNTFFLDAANGAESRSGNIQAFTHRLGVSTDTPISGTLEIKARPPGAVNFEAIPDASAIDLVSPVSIQVAGVVEEFEFTLTDVTGEAVVTITDTCLTR